MVGYPVTKSELRSRIVPYVKRHLRETQGLDLAWYDPIFTHATRGETPATIVFEGRPWTLPFLDEFGEILEEFGYDWYEFDAFSEYELGVRKVIDGNA